jgi:hypothetical protein
MKHKTIIKALLSLAILVILGLSSGYSQTLTLYEFDARWIITEQVVQCENSGFLRTFMSYPLLVKDETTFYQGPGTYYKTDYLEVDNPDYAASMLRTEPSQNDPPVTCYGDDEVDFVTPYTQVYTFKIHVAPM